MAKFVRVIDTKRCMGCRACVAACAVENYYVPDAPWNVMMEYEVGTFPNVRKVFTAMNCMHCEHPSCKAACDAIGVKAISKNRFGVVLIDYDKCIGCGYCAAVCPYGVPQMNTRVAPLVPGKGGVAYEAIPASERHPTHRKKVKVAEKCTFCWHKLERAVADGKQDRIGKDQAYTPTCDLVCPTQARVFGDLDDPNSTVSRVIGDKRATQLKKEFGTRPQVYYVLEGGDY
ncbi:MAG: 4Fe-4S ferredoxin [Candidatus Rokubacteria bacterium RIFCSPHIGHO2_12_FULL_73_22]|nr:MAG: 4Fe-4S ferredoxin [Candidatus Rokubacteria bacterium RIFCSPHIGHO2_02_FULL_73_26]OGL02237.1 MAG: 4Fe-4S ferredoxin [Candidatus Rokubacteria bacterium RIFCSPHIGHO2_12_FULL_73_22]OGL10121.1 MAG: 4Fe-4S ferredoxin [Candidatus Rokubacteria bacterium RIFCSPLOWO2_02_FULL_73_56]OGL28073.1 MAG: 4Fe-4S ferredoxin [Candidatus Rokubacteria bacterium RIFCSPLOWO2_12_FULL_73_47]